MRLGRIPAWSVHIEIGDVADAAGIVDLIPDVVGALPPEIMLPTIWQRMFAASPSLRVPMTCPPKALPGAVSTSRPHEWSAHVLWT